MKNIKCPVLMILVVLLFPFCLAAQNTPRIDVASFLKTPVLGYHIEEFSVNSSIGIKSLFAVCKYGPMNQVWPSGQMTVFPDLLGSDDLLKDTHFLFDTSAATIISQFESNQELRTEVVFNSYFPTNFKLAQVVAADGHSAYNATISGTFVNGQSFNNGMFFIPEPSIFKLSISGLFFFVLWFYNK